LSGDGVAGQMLVADGAAGFVFRSLTAYGAMAFANNVANFAVTLAADSTLNTNTDYVLFTGAGAGWASENLYGVTFTTDRLTVPVTGIYELKFNGTVKTFPTNTAAVGVKYRVSASAYSTRNAFAKSTAAGDQDTIHFSELVSLVAGDYVQIYVASSASGNLVIEDGYASVQLVRQTA
jgi:hypothetical protein